MSITEITPHIYRLGSFAHNFYVITESGQATVIDAGCSKEWPTLVAGLKEIGMAPENVAGMVITHGHADHIGCAGMASKAGISVQIHEEERTRALRTYKGKEAVAPYELPVWKPALWRNFMPMIKAGVMKQFAVPDIETFSDGDVLDLPGSPVAIHTPGHTEGTCLVPRPRPGRALHGRRAGYDGTPRRTRRPATHAENVSQRFSDRSDIGRSSSGAGCQPDSPWPRRAMDRIAGRRSGDNPPVKARRVSAVLVLLVLVVVSLATKSVIAGSGQLSSLIPVTLATGFIAAVILYKNLGGDSNLARLGIAALFGVVSLFIGYVGFWATIVLLLLVSGHGGS